MKNTVQYCRLKVLYLLRYGKVFMFLYGLGFSHILYRAVQLIRGNLTSKNRLYGDNHRLFHIVIQGKKDLSLNFIDRTREWHNGLFFDQKCMSTYKITIRFWLNIIKLSQNGRQTTKYTVYKHTDIFKTWTDRQMASRRHVILRVSLTISGSTTPHTPRAIVAVHRSEGKKNKNSVSLAI